MAVQFWSIFLVGNVASLVLRSIHVVREHQQGLVTRLGRYHRVVGAGQVFLAPFVEDLIRVDLRERRVELRDRPARTAGGDPLSFDAVVRYQIVDAVKATYEVMDIDAACSLAAEEALRSEIAQESKGRGPSFQPHVAARAQARLVARSQAWGLTIHELELQHVRPAGS